MASDEENDEYENDRTKLLSENPDEATRKLHCEMGRFIYPHSDSEVNHTDIELRYVIFIYIITLRIQAISMVVSHDLLEGRLTDLRPTNFVLAFWPT